jgi:hypothetical protein
MVEQGIYSAGHEMREDLPAVDNAACDPHRRGVLNLGHIIGEGGAVIDVEPGQDVPITSYDESSWPRAGLTITIIHSSTERSPV